MTTLPCASSTGFTWAASSYSGNQGNCLEVAHGALPSAMPVRDSKRPAGPAIVVSDTAWGLFLDGVKASDAA